MEKTVISQQKESTDEPVNRNLGAQIRDSNTRGEPGVPEWRRYLSGDKA